MFASDNRNKVKAPNPSLITKDTEGRAYYYNGIDYTVVHPDGNVGIVGRNDALAVAIVNNETRNMEQVESQFSKYPIRLKRKVREALYDIDEHDIIHDDKIEQLTPSEFFMHVCQYDGLLGSYHSQIKGWVKDIFGVDLDDIQR